MKMLLHPTIDNLHHLKLSGMVHSLESQMQSPEALSLPFDDRFGMLVDAELTSRDNKRLQGRLQAAKLKQSATIEDLDFKTPRGLDRTLLLKLATSDWAKSRKNIVIDGSTGSGKSFIISALAQKCCRDGYTVFYERAPKLFNDLAIAKATGRYGKILANIAHKDVLAIDDFGLSVLTDEQRHDLLEIMEERYERKSTMVAAQLPIDKWHEAIGEPTIADAILDRLIHNAYKIQIKTKESMRKRKTTEP
jgi:DNA replication protein DnaC